MSDENRRRMKREADWWSNEAEWANVMVSGEMLGWGHEGEGWLWDFERKRKLIEASNVAVRERAERLERLRMPFEQLRRDPKLWAETRRDVDDVLGKIAQGASRTANMVEAGLLSRKSVEQLRQALAEHDAAQEEEMEDGDFHGDAS